MLQLRSRALPAEEAGGCGLLAKGELRNGQTPDKSGGQKSGQDHFSLVGFISFGLRSFSILFVEFYFACLTPKSQRLFKFRISSLKETKFQTTPFFLAVKARTLRLLASVYLEMNQEEHFEKALNAVTLANNVSCFNLRKLKISKVEMR